MKKKAIIIAAVCLSLLVLFSGCRDECETSDDCEAGQVCKEGTCASKDGGFGGIEGEFVVPSELWENSEFTVDLQVKNTGEHLVNNSGLRVYLGGITLTNYGVDNDTAPWSNESIYFPTTAVIKDTNDVELYGAEEEGGELIEGGITDLDFSTSTSGGKLEVPADYKDVEATLEATLCYPYTTNAKATVCVGDIKPGEDYTCESNEDKTVDSSRAPVQVTRVKQTGSGTVQSFTIYFENAGDGITYVEEFTGTDGESCVGDIEKSEKNKVNVTSVKVADTSLECGGETSLAAGRINCQYTASKGQSVSAAQLEIEIEYNYRDKVSKKYTIKGA